MNKLTLTLPAALFACALFVGASPFVEAAGGRGGGHGGGGRGFSGPVIKGQALAVPGGVRNLRGPVKGQALSVPGGVRNLGAEGRRFHGGLGLGIGGGAGYGFRFGFAPWLYESGHIPVPPYFALHPPVYYSHPVPRTYGYSPFAYRSYVRTPEVVEATQAAVITNPYFEKQDKVESKDANEVGEAFSKATPQEIVNPYVNLNDRSDELRIVKTTEQFSDSHQEDNAEDSALSDDETTQAAPQAIENPFVERESEA